MVGAILWTEVILTIVDSLVGVCPIEKIDQADLGLFGQSLEVLIMNHVAESFHITRRREAQLPVVVDGRADLVDKLA